MNKTLTVNFIADKISWTDAMKAFTEEQLCNKLDLLKNSLELAEVKVSKLNNDEVKVSISVNSYRAQAINNDFYIAIAEATNKLKAIIVKDHKKQKKNYTNKIAWANTDIDDKENAEMFLKEKIFFLDSYSIDEAINKIEQTDYEFFAYRDVDANDTVSILYRRYDGNFGVIRCK